MKPEPGHHQFKQSSPHQQRWGQPTVQNQSQVRNQMQNQMQNQVQNQVQNPVQNQMQSQSTGGAYIIPIMIEGNDKKTGSAITSNTYSQPIVRNNVPNTENQNTRV